MGYMQNDALLATGPYDTLAAAVADARALIQDFDDGDDTLFTQLVVGPFQHAGRWMLLQLPDGSKEGRTPSTRGDKVRRALLSHLSTGPVTYTWACFGGDHSGTTQVQHRPGDGPAAAITGYYLGDHLVAPSAHDLAHEVARNVLVLGPVHTINGIVVIVALAEDTDAAKEAVARRVSWSKSYSYDMAVLEPGLVLVEESNGGYDDDDDSDLWE